MTLPNTRRTAQRREEKLYPAWEELLGLHRLDFWHCTIAQKSQAGWPDYVVFGLGWHAFVELKATSLLTGRRGKLSTGQERYKASVEASGGEWKTWNLSDEWKEIKAWLNSKTGRQIT